MRHTGRFTVLLRLISLKQTNSYLLITVYFSSRALQWLRGPNKNIELELETIRSNIRLARPRQTPFPAATTTGQHLLSKASMQTIYANIKSVLKNVRIIKPVSITCGLMVFQRFTGMMKRCVWRRDSFFFASFTPIINHLAFECEKSPF